MMLDRPEEKSASHQALTNEAITLATHGHWERASEINREIIELSPNDVPAYNRLGKALIELGNYEEAREAFNLTLAIAPNNNIAKKNLEKLSLLIEAGSARKGTQPKVSLHQFI